MQIDCVSTLIRILFLKLRIHFLLFPYLISYHVPAILTLAFPRSIPYLVFDLAFPWASWRLVQSFNTESFYPLFKSASLLFISPLKTQIGDRQAHQLKQPVPMFVQRVQSEYLDLGVSLFPLQPQLPSLLPTSGSSTQHHPELPHPHPALASVEKTAFSCLSKACSSSRSQFHNWALSFPKLPQCTDRAALHWCFCSLCSHGQLHTASPAQHCRLSLTGPLCWQPAL